MPGDGAEIALTGALALFQILRPIISDEINLETNAQRDIGCLKSSLESMHAFLHQVEGTDGGQVLQDKITQIRRFAYKIEDILDNFMFHVPQHFHSNSLSRRIHEISHSAQEWLALHDLLSNAKDINTQIDSFLKMNLEPLHTPDVKPPSSAASLCSETAIGWPNLYTTPLVGFRSLRQHILDQLRSSDLRCITISVVGAPGSGKTALVKHVCAEQSVYSPGSFPYIAWIHVPSYPHRREVIVSLISQLGAQHGDGTGGSQRGALRRYLGDKKYIIVLDDVRRKEDLDYITFALPDGSRGSRIIVTSRNESVASSCVRDSTHIHRLKSLKRKDARNLFCTRAFPTSSHGCCPPELEELVDNFVEKCEGLPTAIVAVSSLLSTKPQIPVEWKSVLDSLGTDLSVMRHIERSYDDLRTRSDLKSCFLYFSAFPEKYLIRRQRLIRLWTAEGFVQKERNKSLEEVADSKLNELIHMNLVEVCERDVDGRVRSCRVLNLVREFIISKSEEEKFIKVIEQDISQAEPFLQDFRRLSFVADITTFPWSNGKCMPCKRSSLLENIRSAFVFGNTSSYNYKDFKLLRVLDMQGASLEWFPEQIVALLLLRYLSLQQTKIKNIPRSVKKLSLLETLNLKHTLVIDLPKSIFKLRNLRHLLVYSKVGDNYSSSNNNSKGVEIDVGIGYLATLEKLSLIKATGSIIEELGELHNLRKLGIECLREIDGKRFFESLQNMKNLSALEVSSEAQEVIDLDGNNPDRPSFEFLRHLHLKGRLLTLPRWVLTLTSLIKISLKWSKLETNPLEGLENLPNLMELVMVDTYTGVTLEFKPNTFKRLKILHIEQLSHLSMVTVPEGTMPDLEKLTISKCGNMKILPLGIEGLSHLRTLLVHDMPGEFVDSLRYEDFAAVQHVALIQCFNDRTSQSWVRRNPIAHPI